MGCLHAPGHPSGSDSLDRQPRAAPLGEAVLQAGGVHAIALQRPYRLARERAVRAAAVGHDLDVRGQLAHLFVDALWIHEHRARDVPGVELGSGADIEHHHATLVKAAQEVVSADRRDAVPWSQVGLDQVTEPGDVPGGDLAHRRPQVDDPLTAEPVEDPVACLLYTSPSPRD